jgi:hypothetical protein
MTILLKNFTLIQFFFLLLGLFVNDYAALIVFESILILMYLLNEFGKSIVLREIIALHSVFVLLLMPLVGYKFYTIENPMAKLFVKYMPIDEFDYFHFVFPAVLTFILILCWPISLIDIADKGKPFIRRLELSIDKLHSSRLNPIFLIITGVIMYFIEPYLPLVVKYIGNLFFSTSFVGFLMLYLNPKIKYRKFVMICFIFFLFYISISSSMFTILVYMGMTLASFLFINLRLTLWRKFVLFLLIASSVFFLQNIKGVYREYSGDQNRGIYFLNLFSQEISKGYRDFSTDRFFQIYIRGNQGFLVAKVLNYVPLKKEFDNGTYLGQAFLSSIVPRILWPDKPMAGGRFTMKYFTGEDLVGNTSMNVSPVGEAYGSFGYFFGIIYMGGLAFFVRMAYRTFIVLSNKVPFLIFWFPVVFYQVTYSMETDSLQIFNSLLKSGMFVSILYVVFPKLFGAHQSK